MHLDPHSPPDTAHPLLPLVDLRTPLRIRDLVRQVPPHGGNVACSKEHPKVDGIIKAHMLCEPDPDTRYHESGVGSGIVVRPGDLPTNRHAVFQPEGRRVTFASG